MTRIPSPISVPAGPQKRPGLGENLLLQLAGQAPNILSMFLERQQQGQARDAQEAQSAQFLNLVAQSPDLLTDPVRQGMLGAGATETPVPDQLRQIFPGQDLQSKVDPSTIADPNAFAGALGDLFAAQGQAGQRAQAEATTAAMVSGTGIAERGEPGALAAQGAGTELTEAQTVSLGIADRLRLDLHPSELELISSQIASIQAGTGATLGTEARAIRAEPGVLARTSAEIAAIRGAESRAAALHPLIRQDLLLGVEGKSFLNGLNREYSRAERESGLDATQVGIEQARQAIDTSILNNDLAIARLLSDQYNDHITQMQNFAQILGSDGGLLGEDAISPEGAIALASQMVFRTDRPPVKNEWIAGQVGELTVARLLSGQDDLQALLAQSNDTENIVSTFATETLGFTADEFAAIKNDANRIIANDFTEENILSAFNIQRQAIVSDTYDPVMAQHLIEQLAALFSIMYPYSFDARVATKAVGGRWFTLNTMFEAMARGVQIGREGNPQDDISTQPGDLPPPSF